MITRIASRAAPLLGGLLILFSSGALISCGGPESGQETTTGTSQVQQAQGAAGGTLTVALEWQGEDGTGGSKQFPDADIAGISGRGLWVAFQEEGGQAYPGVSVNGEFERADVPVGEMTALDLVVTVKVGDQTLTKRSVLFSDTRPLGTQTAAPENVYHLLVLDDFIDAGALPDSLAENAASAPEWADAFWRTHRLAMNYAAQSDAKTQEYEEAFQVKANYALPRLVLVAEEWIEVPEEVRKKAESSGGGGLFGGAGSDIAGMMGGDEEEAAPKTIPVYSVDVLLDEVEAEGKYSIGFQAARSVWNDVLEGKVIYEAGGGKRRVLSATIVFSQLQKNRAERESDNRVLSVDAGNLGVLDQCEDLWPAAKADISTFLTSNPEWQVIIPEQPVAFFEGDTPIYAMYAWYQVHPTSGRMVGVLPNGTRGAMSDEISKFQETLMKKARDRIVAEAGGGAVKGFFAQIAGMYVSAGGIIEAITLTFCDPSIAALQGEDWLKFLAMHSLDYCEKFLEDNADQYDSYAALLGFWQGAMVLTGALGGKDAWTRAAEKAFDSVKKKAESDIKSYVEDKIKAAENIAGEALNEALETYAPELHEAIEGLREIQDYLDKGGEMGEKAADAIDRFEAAMEDFRNELKERGIWDGD
ncbi:MAG: hypothetical protein IH851_09410 [Armatimonadetes bacterium]|nr:hypothetical protein [Armatimonadota bacterium]